LEKLVSRQQSFFCWLNDQPKHEVRFYAFLKFFLANKFLLNLPFAETMPPKKQKPRREMKKKKKKPIPLDRDRQQKKKYAERCT